MIFFIQIPTYQPTLSITKWLITKWPHEMSHTKCPPRSGPHDIVLHEVTASRTPLVSAYYFKILMSKEKSIRNVRFNSILNLKYRNRKIFLKVLFMLFVYLLFPYFFIISITFLDCISNILNSCFDNKAYSLGCFDYRTGRVDLIR